MFKDIRVRHSLLLLVLSYFFFMLGNGILSLTMPDEVFYAQTAKEMVSHGTWMTPYLFGQPQFEKPILLYWLLRIGFIMFGVTSFAARFFPAVFASIGVLATYWLGLAGFKDEKKAFLSALLLMSCGLYIGLARTVFTDMIFSVCILLSMASFYWGYASGRKRAGMVTFFFFAGLAVLAKGPLGLIIPLTAILIFLFLKRDLKSLLSGYFLLGAAVFCAVALPWYAWIIKKYGSVFINEFYYNDHVRRVVEAEHANCDTWYFYPASTIGCFFPWSLYLAAALFFLGRRATSKMDDFQAFVVCWISVTFVVFQTAHSKLVSYILPLFPALAFITADFMHGACANGAKSRLFKVLSVVTVAMLLMVLAAGAIMLPRFSKYVHSPAPIYSLIAIMALLLLVCLFLIRNRAFLKFIYIMSATIPVLLFAVPFTRDAIEPFASSKEACDYLLKNYKVPSPIVCSKNSLRAVRFYTDMDVCVFQPYGSNFFSPHPVLFLTVDKDAVKFFRSRPVTYAVLRKSGFEDIERLSPMGFKYTLLKVIGNSYIVKIAP